MLHRAEIRRDGEVGTLAVDGWAVTFDTARMGLGGSAVHQGPFLLYQNVTAHPSTASVPITVLLYNGSLLCGFDVSVKGEKVTQSGDCEVLHGIATVTQLGYCEVLRY